MIEKFLDWLNDVMASLEGNSWLRTWLVDIGFSMLMAIFILSFVLGGCILLEMVLDKIF